MNIINKNIGGSYMWGIVDILEDNPIIAAIKDVDDVDMALSTDVGVIFMLCGSILDIKEIADRVKAKNKKIFVHIDLINGLGRDDDAIKFLKMAGVDGVITTKPSLIKVIKNEGLIAIQRLFMLDSRSLETGIKSILEDKPHAVEIMPGLAYKVIERIHNYVNIPIIAGGLMIDKCDIINALSCGAVGISTSSKKLWLE